MIQSIVKLLIPGASILAGLAFAGFIGAQRAKPEAVVNANVAGRFAALSVAEQEGLLVRAKLLNDLKEDEDQAEWERLQRLHADVQQDPELAAKLKRFHQWWGNLDASDRQRIFPDRTFGDNWLSEVQLVYAAGDIRKHQIPVRLWSQGPRRDSSSNANFTEEAYEEFLEHALPSPLPSGLQEKIGQYDKGCDRNLFLTIFLLRESRKQQSPGGRAVPPPETVVSMARMKQAAIDYLASSEYADKMRASTSAVSVMPFLKAAFDFYGEQFRKKYLVSPDDEMLSLYEGLDRDVQLELMKTDATEARNEIKNLLITKLGSENPAIAELARDAAGISRFFEEMKRMFEWGSRPGSKNRGARGGFGGNRPRDDRQPPGGGPGDRRDEGRGSRGPGEGKPEGGPPRDGQRPSAPR